MDDHKRALLVLVDSRQKGSYAEVEGCPDVPLYLTVWNDFGDSEWVGRRY